MTGAHTEMGERGEIRNIGITMTKGDAGVEVYHVFENGVVVVDEARAAIMKNHHGFWSDRVPS